MKLSGYYWFLRLSPTIQSRNFGDTISKRPFLNPTVIDISGECSPLDDGFI